MTASIRASKFKCSEIHKSKLSSAEDQRKKKRALDNAQKAKKKIEAQQTRTLDLLKGLCKRNQKIMLEVFRVNEIGEPTILRPLSAERGTHRCFQNPSLSVTPQFFAVPPQEWMLFNWPLPQVDELLERMASTIKTFPSLRVAPLTDGATRRLNFPQLCQCD